MDSVLIIDGHNMKIRIFFLCLAIVAGCVKKKTGLTFQNTTFNFGQAKVGEDISAVFKFSNGSRDTILIYDVTHDCNCLSFGQKTYPYAVLPKSTDSLVVRIDGTVERPGLKSKNIGIRTNGNPSIQMLKIEGEIL